MSTEWNAAAYARLSDPQYRWGQKLVEGLALRGDETVVDAGCGAGRVTADLLARLPRGRVLALDLSFNMVAEARKALAPRFGAGARFLQADLQAVPLAAVADGVFSTATFHWVPDHARLFAGLFAALKPGGWLIAQCGGGPNLKRLRDRTQALMASPRFAPLFRDWTTPWRYPEPEETATRLRSVGFIEIKTWLEESPVTLPDAPTFRDFEAHVTLHRHLACISDEALRSEFLDVLTLQFGQDSPPFTLDYWRLNLRARKLL